VFILDKMFVFCMSCDKYPVDNGIVVFGSNCWKQEMLTFEFVTAMVMKGSVL
jgi:hypothetical protein